MSTVDFPLNCISPVAARSRRRIGWRVATLLILLNGGCLWRSYPEALATHLDALTKAAAKLVVVCQSERGLPVDGVEEFAKPSLQARAFLRQYDSHKDERSYQQLGVFLDRYDALLDRVEASRAEGGKVDPEWLTAELNLLLHMAAAIRGSAVPTE